MVSEEVKVKVPVSALIEIVINFYQIAWLLHVAVPVQYKNNSNNSNEGFFQMAMRSHPQTLPNILKVTLVKNTKALISREIMQFISSNLINVW